MSCQVQNPRFASVPPAVEFHPRTNCPRRLSEALPPTPVGTPVPAASVQPTGHEVPLNAMTVPVGTVEDAMRSFKFWSFARSLLKVAAEIPEPANASSEAGEVQALPTAAYTIPPTSTVVRKEIPMTIPERTSCFRVPIFKKRLANVGSIVRT